MMKEASTHHTITASRVGKWLHHLPTQKVQINSVGKQNRVYPPTNYCAPTSNALTSPANLSKTPLTYLKPSVPPKLLAISTASLMTTL